MKYPTTASYARTITPFLVFTTGIVVTEIVCPANSQTTSFRIGLDRSLQVSSFIIRWFHSDEGYIPIKALQIIVTFQSSKNKNNKLNKNNHNKYLKIRF